MRRALRGALAVAVAAGYLVALGGTAAGNGWRLVPHLALDHAEPTARAPGLAADVAGGPAIPTLRPSSDTRAHGHSHPHSHGADGHTHGSNGSHSHMAPARRSRTVRAAAPVKPSAESGLHEHDGVFHSHAPPDPEPAVLLTVSLDKHRLPATLAVPVPPASSAADLGDGAEAPASVVPAVETPPPIQRG